jgi:hypothetical protein
MKNDSIQELQAALSQLRQDPKTQRKFPRELWEAVIHLTKTHSIKEISHCLRIHPGYLKRKVEQSQKQSLEFREVIIPSSFVPSTDLVTIEITSPTGLKAKIQGPISCTNCLQRLFRGV